MSALDLDTRIDVTNGVMTVARTQDCTAIAENAKRRQIEGEVGSSDMRLAAKIPYVIVEKYCNDNGVEFSEFMGNREHMKRILNDPSLSAFRIWPGRV